MTYSMSPRISNSDVACVYTNYQIKYVIFLLNNTTMSTTFINILFKINKN